MPERVLGPRSGGLSLTVEWDILSRVMGVAVGMDLPNKAAVGLACRIHDRTVAFVTAHFAADKHGKQHLPDRIRVSSVCKIECVWEDDTTFFSLLLLLLLAQSSPYILHWPNSHRTSSIWPNSHHSDPCNPLHCHPYRMPGGRSRS